MPDTNNQRLLRKAADLLGHQQLATRLKVSESLIEAWISGEATVPDRKLLMLADALVTWATETKQK